MNKDKNKGFWEIKPLWCQPWSIICFGVLVLVSIWELFGDLILSSIVGLIIFSWWVLFLIIVPNSYN